MVHPSSTSLLEIVLDTPHVTIPEQTGRGPSRGGGLDLSESDGHHAVLCGRLIVRLTRSVRIKSLNLILTGAAHTSFPVVLPLTNATHGKAVKKAPSATDSHYQHSFKFLTHTWSFFESNPKGACTLEPGVHSFPFSVNIDPSLPCTFTTATTAVHYQLTALLRPASFISFVQGTRISRPVILLPSHNQALLDAAHGFETSGYMRLQDTPTTRQSLERISGEAHFPCRIFAQTGVIPVTIGLTLLGQGTALTKMSVELWEAVYRLDDNNDSNAERQPLSVRLTSRQNCPLSADWEPSTVDTPSILSKRLLFKVPELPVSTWCKNKDGYTAVPGRGFCHISGEYLCSKIKIEHTLKLVLGYQYEVPVEEDPFRNSRRSSTGGSSISEDTIVVREEIIEAEEKVMIVSHADSDVGHDDAEPPCYYRSFASVPVNPSDIQFIDAAIAQTLHDDPHHPPHGDQHGHAGARLPDYEECIESTSIVGSNNSGNGTRANSIRSLSSMSTREALSGYSSTSSLGHFSMMQETNTGAVSPPLRPSLELHQHRDLSSYIERYSRGEAPSVPF